MKNYYVVYVGIRKTDKEEEKITGCITVNGGTIKTWEDIQNVARQIEEFHKLDNCVVTNWKELEEVD